MHRWSLLLLVSSSLASCGEPVLTTEAGRAYGELRWTRLHWAAEHRYDVWLDAACADELRSQLDFDFDELQRLSVTEDLDGDEIRDFTSHGPTRFHVRVGRPTSADVAAFDALGEGERGNVLYFPCDFDPEVAPGPEAWTLLEELYEAAPDGWTIDIVGPRWCPASPAAGVPVCVGRVPQPWFCLPDPIVTRLDGSFDCELVEHPAQLPCSQEPQREERADGSCRIELLWVRSTTLETCGDQIGFDVPAEVIPVSGSTWEVRCRTR